MLAVSATPSFSRVAKKLHARDKKVLDEATEAMLLAVGPDENFYAGLKR
ncbi:hypothetical protein [Limnohabitans sp. DM1]|nr:hypothetical protein [Limnohabitans sp. DM1]